MTNGGRRDDAAGGPRVAGDDDQAVAAARAAYTRLRDADAASAPDFAATWARAQAQAHGSGSAQRGRRGRIAFGLGALAAAAAVVLVVVRLPPHGPRANTPPPSAIAHAAPLAWSFPVSDPEPLAFLLDTPRVLAQSPQLEASR